MHVRPLVVVCAVGLLVVAGSAVARPSAVPTAQLALMPRPLSAYGPDAVGLTLDTDGMGVETNAQRAADTNDTKDSAAGFAAAGRVTGFDLSYSDFARLGKRGKLVIVGSRLEVYAGGRQASSAIDAELRELETGEPSGSIVVESSKRFPAA